MSGFPLVVCKEGVHRVVDLKHLQRLVKGGGDLGPPRAYAYTDRPNELVIEVDRMLETGESVGFHILIGIDGSIVVEEAQ